MKKALSLTILLIVFTFAMPILINAEELSGTFGSTDWVFDDVSGKLTISGSGGVPDNVTAMQYPWYEYRKSIKSVVIENSVTSIGSLAFAGCSNLTDVSMGDNVQSIGSSAFSSCSSLKKIELPNKITKISASLFYECTSLEEIIIPEKVTLIDSYAFYRCTNLKSVELGEDVVKINDNAFYGCDNLKSVYIKSLEKWCNVKMKSQSSSPFSNGSDLYLNGEKITSLTINNVTKINDYVFSGCGSITKLFVGDNVNEIGEGSFKNCSNIKSLSIGDGVTKFGNGTFNNCTSLEIVKLSDNLTAELGVAMFAYCSNIESVEIPVGISTIGSLAFRNCTSLKSIEIPMGITSIGEGAFLNCTNLADIYFGGNKEDWESITVSRYNDNLENVTIYYNSKIQKEINITHTYKNGKVAIEAENLDDGCVIIVKGTQDDVVTVRVHKYAYDEDNAVEIGMGYDCIKVMIWKSIDVLEPICEPIFIY